MTSRLEDELTASLAEEMQKTMDFEILCDLYVPFGWTRIETEYNGGQKWVDVVEWTSKNCSGEYKEHNGVWLFKDAKDATAFALRWI
jgi:hypothetical protein